ncbi:nucleoside phosphorylase [Homoserinimonas sp. OAct 916]|uniref:nucleoside phosphorylase n=1 Tax=Homoserinimonas sp. OAct 916 TaxID=2211450 RepID=UPI000DBE536D|nr:nucleoside phosphorylase [Homoserinimonas sp. OAct 916]
MKGEIMSEKRVAPPQFVDDGVGLLTGITPGSVAPNVIIAVHDPLGFEADAADVISEYFDERTLIGGTTMFRTYTGTYKGTPITVCGTGGGAPETELAFGELVNGLGESDVVPTFIRIGTSGSAAPNVSVGDLVIATACVRDEATSAAYVSPSYPAVSSFEVVAAMADAATALDHPFHLGITRSTDSIFAGQGRPFAGYNPPGIEDIATTWANAKVLNYEREASIILTLANLLGYRSGNVCTVVNSAVSGEVDAGAGVREAILTGLDGLALLAKRDSIAQNAGKSLWVPSMGS